jgi:hypothetical protein
MVKEMNQAEPISYLVSSRLVSCATLDQTNRLGTLLMGRQGNGTRLALEQFEAPCDRFCMAV